MIVILIVMMMLVMVVMCLFLLFLCRSLLNASDPTGRGSDSLKIEESGVDQIIQGHLRIITLNDLCGRLQRANDLLDTGQLLRLHLRSLVEQDQVTELDLLDDQILDVLLVDVLTGQLIATSELALQAQRIHYGCDTI